MSRKGPATNLFDSLQQKRCLKISKIFFNTVGNLEVEVRNYCVYPNFQRYIRTIVRFTKEEAEVRKQTLPFVHHALSELLKLFPN